MTKTQYRHLARLAYGRARAELDSSDNDRLRYAAVDLRLAMECLAYERVVVYKAELPSEKLGIWQPNKILKVLLEIDPSADKTRSLSYAIESSPGVAAEPFKSLGTERILSITEINKYYARLGSYLHAPTIAQAEEEKETTPDHIRARCLEIAEVLREALDSAVFSTDMRISATVECEKCGDHIIRRLPREGGDSVEATCPSCGVGYLLSQLEGNVVDWQPKQTEVQCGGNDCGLKVFVFESEVRLGNAWVCDNCDGQNVFALGIRHVPHASSSGDGKAGKDGVL